MATYSSGGNAYYEKEPNCFSNHTKYYYNTENDDVIISGISGRFPECDTIEEFGEKLMAGVNLITDDERRWPRGIYGLPSGNGKIKNLQHFDASFFGVPPKLAHVMDPQLRLLLEATYEAIVDAGVNPTDIRGSRTGVFVAEVTGESEEYWGIEPDKVTGYAFLGCSSGMFSNRVSYAFDFRGPSYTLNVACAGSIFAFQQAFKAIRSGECDSAIIGGVNTLLKPINELHLHRLNMLSPDGKPRCFDANANGYVRSEAVTAVFLQKASVANRIYATILNARTNNDGYKEEGFTRPSSKMQAVLLRETYAEIGITPSDISYFEAHAPGTKIGDPIELNTISDVFFKSSRSKPLMIGSVKSNMGHAESAAGLCSIAKVIIAMETGTIPGNLHFKNPNPNVAALYNGRFQVIDKNTSWPGGVVAINCFGVGGCNGHVVLESNSKKKTSVTPDKIPRLVLISGRTEKAVNTFFEKLSKQPIDVELIGLLHNIHKTNTPGHNSRGYIILGDKIQQEVQSFNGEKRPTWFVYGGLGTQWAGMGRDLMVLKPFKQAIEKCADVLKPEGFDLIDIIMRNDNSIFNNIINTFTSITAIQVALTDLLSAIGILPDGFLGHSIGELGCAYADGTLTAEQVVLAAYWRGRCVLESKSPSGAMAAVAGLSWKEVKARAPPGITLACHNGVDVVTVAGLSEDVKKFVMQLKEDGVLAKEVASCGYAFHSGNIADAAPKFKTQLEKIIPKPKPRSSKWISTSIPESSWITPLAASSSPAYHVNNFLSPVLFYNALQHIPEDAVLLEIAPHALLQSVLKRSLGDDYVNIGLINRNQPDNLQFLLSIIGKAYIAGLQPNVAKLYKPIKFPVSRGTPMIQSMIRWDHSAEWTVPDFRKVSRNLINDNGSTGTDIDRINRTNMDYKPLTDKSSLNTEEQIFDTSSGLDIIKYMDVVPKFSPKSDSVSSIPAANCFPDLTVQFGKNRGFGLSLRVCPFIGSNGMAVSNSSIQSKSSSTITDDNQASSTIINEKKKKDQLASVNYNELNLTNPNLIGCRKNSLETSHPVFAEKFYTVKSDSILEERRIFKRLDSAGSGETGFVSAVAEILGIGDIKSINGSPTLVDLGLDSIMSAEVGHILENYNIVLRPDEIRCLTFKRLAQLATKSACQI